MNLLCKAKHEGGANKREIFILASRNTKQWCMMGANYRHFLRKARNGNMKKEISYRSRSRDTKI